MSHLFNHRPIRVCYLPREDNVVDVDRLRFEKALHQVAELDLVTLGSLRDPKLHPCDLLVAFPGLNAKSNFHAWVHRLLSSIERQAGIWVPVIFVATDPESLQLNHMFSEAVGRNWYFDVVSPAELATLPIRAANLLRIHDHLHELKRYEHLLIELQESVARLEKKSGKDN